jgi:hypothetical protein
MNEKRQRAFDDWFVSCYTDDLNLYENLYEVWDAGCGWMKDELNKRAEEMYEEDKEEQSEKKPRKMNVMKTLHSYEAEQYIIGACLKDNSVWESVNKRISHLDFYRAAHSDCFDVISGLMSTDGHVDVVTLMFNLKHTDYYKKMLDEKGFDGEYIKSLVNSITEIKNIDAYVDIIKETSCLRLLLSMLEQSIYHIYRGACLDNVLIELEGFVEEIKSRNSSIYTVEQ